MDVKLFVCFVCLFLDDCLLILSLFWSELNPTLFGLTFLFLGSFLAKLKVPIWPYDIDSFKKIIKVTTENDSSKKILEISTEKESYKKNIELTTEKDNSKKNTTLHLVDLLPIDISKETFEVDGAQFDPSNLMSTIQRRKPRLLLRRLKNL